MIDSRTKVLIVDDDITSQRIMEKIIRISVGMQSFSCRRWLRSFENYAERASQFSYFRRCDAVHEMRIQVLQTMRKSSRLAKMNLLACTAVDDHKIGKEVLKYGVPDYLIKPLNKETLVDNLTKLFKTIN